MARYETSQLEKLKAELLNHCGIREIMPSDCKRLSADIYAKTHLQVSETTIKRVYGFACTEFMPSTFTITAMARYCGYHGWNNFIEHNSRA
ncbi:hypothetical protein [Mucilaginibacter myungsuensis]|uniref:Uncharacterized protein n=1 Tax=Mucilaginibacter myungsuensis TaxID=649104 RepID=A0A929L0I7_9SPHI|nr:hypothetical protein [Mucilaginibacter myungsuensis]MBE9661905.1 hypothetical protein [Mucilaginibacter myungsuensis]MDN3599661.1 hypothetical protein [Mucilaginibacter myungsuensis]